MASTNGNAKAVLGVPFMDEIAIAQAFEELEAASSSEGDSSQSSHDESSNAASGSEFSDEDESIESSITSCSDDSSDLREAHPNGIPELLEFTEDELADVTQCLASNAIVSALAERGAMMMSINWLAAHVPICVLDHLGDEIRGTGEVDYHHASYGDITNDSAVSELSNQQHTPKDDFYVPDECDTVDRPQKPLHRQDSGLNPREENRTFELENGALCEEGGTHPVRLRRNSLPSSFLAGMGVQLKIAAIAHAENDDNAGQQTVDAEGKSRRRSLSPTMKMLTSATEIPPDAPRPLFDSDTRNSLIPSSNARQLPIPEDGVLDENGPADEGISLERRLLLRAFGLGVSARNGARGDAPSSTYRDPFPDADSDNEQPKDRKTSQGSGTRTSRKRSSVLSRRYAKDFGAEGMLPLPHASAHQCALLFVDISGFTRLATALDPEHLSKAINSYFQMIINEVTAHGGDVLKFAGDGVFVEWKASSPGSSPGLMGSQQLSLTECVRVAAVCAASIVAKCSDFPIFAHNPLGSGGQGSQVATLNVHCGLGVGQIVGVHVGDYDSRREYVILGDPIDQVCTAVNAATLGEVATSPQALVTLTKSCSFHESVLAGPQNKPAVIACRTMSLFHSRNGLGSENVIVPPPLQLAQTVEAWQMTSLKRLQKLMALYVHPVVVANDSSTRLNPRSMSTVQERHREEAELRSVFVLFITPLISVRVTGRKEADTHLFNLLNNIMNLATRELNRFSGHLRQFIVDDKGVVLIATFGLRGSTFPNMVAERALPATITLHNALQSELGVQNQVGATIGNTYCGVVGGIKRHEYAVMGPSVNLAARLMSSPKNPGILVDNAVRMVGDKSYAFNALAPVKAKGYSDPVPIFEPLSPLERSWGRVQPNFVGRKNEIMTIKGIAREMALTQCPSTMVYISGESGMGKSTLVVHSIEHVRKLMGATRRRVIITKHVSKESDLLVPFGIFRSILVSVLSYFKTSQDDRSYASRSSSGMDSIGWESLSGRSFDASVATGLTRSADRFSVICRELNAPAAFEELVGHHLLGAENKPRESFKMRAKASTMKSLVTFMAKAFKRCIQEADLVLVALDDVHNMDEMSWKVVQELFETTFTILFLCTSRPMSTYRLLVDASFWGELNGEFMAQGRFHMMTVERLQDKEVKTMIAKTLGLQESEISATLMNDVLMQSNGMPHFANEILETMKRQNGNSTRLLDDKAGDVAYASVGELLLHRIDSFDASVRKVLNIGAVLGSSFEMNVLVAVLLQMSKEKLDFRTVCKKAKCALDVAVSEGILYAVVEGGDLLEDNNDDAYSLFGEAQGFQDSLHSIGDASHPGTVGSRDSHLVYTFCHDIWRTTILNLMLDSRKRDMHLTIAKTLEKQDGHHSDDYLSRMKLFSHWRASGESKKAASLALSIGRSFEELGLQDQSTKVFQDALSMWNVGGDSEDFSRQALENLSVTDLECVINVYVALAKSLANSHRAADSVAAYQNALRVLQGSRVSDSMPDRSILFPIFSGLFSALQFGQIDQDEECTYEQSLVARFVYETRVHGDPVHYSRALAMQGEMYGRLGLYEKALDTHSQLAVVYDAEEHSTTICDVYGHDHAAQSFCMSAVWCVQLGDTARAMDVCRYVFDDLFPEMEKRNVHNSCCMIYPLLWILKNDNRALVARDLFERFVMEPFDEYFGDGRSTFCLPVFEPIMMVLTLAGSREVDCIAESLEWALNEDNLRFGTVINCTLGSFGRCADSISAEICLFLAERTPTYKNQCYLIQTGISIANEVRSLAEVKRMFIAGQECQDTLARLLEMGKKLNVPLI